MKRKKTLQTEEAVPSYAADGPWPFPWVSIRLESEGEAFNITLHTLVSVDAMAKSVEKIADELRKLRGLKI
ncbi:hypothetical protein [Candidatus Hecatella orcuttiae]|jgi:hypothetical protein|uniref:hypothetical protein n=1 Tax=Candidatus Hecatella orcuttiae TaxID=1935119 RepID=UPI0028682BF9|nr:hypothetical protein [Candidatus Hecatella orcuttiae]